MRKFFLLGAALSAAAPLFAQGEVPSPGQTAQGDVAVTKYKTSTKMASADGYRQVVYLVAQAQDLGTVYIGYSYVDDYGDEQIYWFPYDMILDGDTGAIDYVPEAD